MMWYKYLECFFSIMCSDEVHFLRRKLLSDKNSIIFDKDKYNSIVI